MVQSPIVCLLQGHFERPPYTTSTMRSAYHVRELEAYRLKQLKRPVDIMLSHDWPDGIAYHGDLGQLLKCKPFLKTDVSFLQGRDSFPLLSIDPAFQKEK